jgi:hypothetical protein
MAKALKRIEKGPMTLSSRIKQVLESNKIVKIWAYEQDDNGNMSNTQVQVFLKIANIDAIILASVKAAERGDTNAAKFLLERAYAKEDLQKQSLMPNIKTFQIDTTKLSPEEYAKLVDFENRSLGQ